MKTESLFSLKLIPILIRIGFTALYICIFCKMTFAEGTKQMTTSGTANNVELQINRSAAGGFASLFGGWTATSVNDRIFIHINDYTTEKIYLGFRSTTTGSIYYRIKRPDGTIIAGPTLIPTSANPGYIASWSEANIGPNTLIGNTGGYNPTVIDLNANANSRYNGDFYIEFNKNITANNTMIYLKYYDITVANGTSNSSIKNGRLWSYNWGFNSGGYTLPYICNGSLFIYASDSIVNEIDLNGISPYYFRIFSNSTGVTNTGNIIEDRKSKSFPNGANPNEIPEFRVFFNNPDTIAYPSARIANRTATFNSLRGCPGNYCFNFTVNGSALSELKLDINNNGSYSDSIDRVLESNVVSGENCIPWDGKDGFGNTVSINTTFNLELYTRQGVVHIPIYDAELHANGFLAKTIRPAGIGDMTMYWDDRNISAGNKNLTGTIPNVPVSGDSIGTGLHTWLNTYGNEKVINTWFTTRKKVINNFPVTLSDFSASLSTSSNESCTGLSNGSAAVTAVNGNLPYSYNWNSVPTQTLANATGLTAGNYICTVSDNIGCSIPVTVTIGTTNPLPIISISGNNTICVGENSSLTPVTGGIWISNDASVASVNNAGIVTGISKGISTFTFTNSTTSCSSTTSSITINNCINPITENGSVTSAAGGIAITNVASNDKINNIQATLGLNGNATVSQYGSWPNGITLNTTNGAISVVSGTIPGNYPVIYELCDKLSITDCKTMTDTIKVTNSAPVANWDNFNTNEDIAIIGSVISNDILNGNGNFQWTLVSGSLSGSLVLNNNGSFTYSPNANFNGSDRFIYRLCDANSNCDTAIVYIKIISVNDTPSAVSDINTTLQNTAVNGHSQNNDNPSGDGGNIWSLTGPNGGAAHGIVTMDTAGNYTYTPTAFYIGTDIINYKICDADNDCSTATITITIGGTNYCLNLKVLLQGPYDINTHLMWDSLRVHNYIPTTEPYSSFPYNQNFTHISGGGNESISNPSAVFGVTGPNAIVDWVFIELRDKNNNKLVKYTKSALLQRDGDIVSTDGFSPLCFQGLTDNQFYIAVRHRNHLGVMTANSKTLTTQGITVDFRNGSETEFNYGTNHPLAGSSFNFTGLSQYATSDGKRAMWYGDANCDHKVKNEAPADDQSITLIEVLLNPNNLSFQSSYDFCYGYYKSDVDLSGKAKYEAPFDDQSLILLQVLLYPLNTSYQSAFDFMYEQIPY